MRVEAAFHSHSALIVSIQICMSIYLPKDPAITPLGSVTSFNQVVDRASGLFPFGPSTPNLDSYAWDPLSRRPITPDTPPKSRGGVNGAHQPTEVRFHNQAQVYEPNGDSDNRPLFGKEHSPEFSIASAISEEP